MKKIILILLLLTGCGVYDSEGVYINKNTRYIKYDSIAGKHIIIKYVPIYRYSSPYYNHFYDIHRYPTPYRYQNNYPNYSSSSSTRSYSRPSSTPSAPSTPSVSAPSGGKSKAGKIQ